MFPCLPLRLSCGNKSMLVGYACVSHGGPESPSQVRYSRFVHLGGSGCNPRSVNLGTALVVTPFTGILDWRRGGRARHLALGSGLWGSFPECALKARMTTVRSTTWSRDSKCNGFGVFSGWLLPVFRGSNAGLNRVPIKAAARRLLQWTGANGPSSRTRRKR